MTDEKNTGPESGEDAKRPVERLVMVIQREDAARLVEKQLNWETDGSKGSRYYGARALRELLDYIYCGEPKTESEKISIDGIGWH